jgi:hypothetical protein
MAYFQNLHRPNLPETSPNPEWPWMQPEYTRPEIPWPWRPDDPKFVPDPHGEPIYPKWRPEYGPGGGVYDPGTPQISPWPQPIGPGPWLGPVPPPPIGGGVFRPNPPTQPPYGPISAPWDR